MTRTVFLAGEGRTELGGWYESECDRPSDGVPAAGVLEALLESAISPAEFQILDAEPWRGRDRLKRLQIFRLKAGEPNEALKVRRLALLAEKQGCDTLVFVRDRDGYRERERDIETGIDQVAVAQRATVVGGIAIEAIESWLCSIQSRAGAEKLTDPKSILEAKTTEDKVAIVRSRSLDRLPSDAVSLRTWRDRARVAFRVDCEATPT
jgi:hypothetical protein